MVLNTVDDFSKLKQQFLDSFCKNRNKNDLLRDSLRFFQKIIDSPRTLSRINNFEELFQVLERRDVLSENNVSILKEWANIMKWPGGQPLLEQYEKLSGFFKHDPRCDVCLTLIQFDLNKPRDPSPEKPVLKREESVQSNNSDDLDDAFELISEKLGRTWKDLARKFKLTEYDIQGIEKENRLIDCAYCAFTFWKEKAGNGATVAKLIQALQRCRRKDLVDIITDRT